MTKIKIGLIGLGRIGMMHLKNLLNLSDLYEVVAISDPFKTNLKDIAQDHHISNYSKNYQDVLIIKKRQTLMKKDGSLPH